MFSLDTNQRLISVNDAVCVNHKPCSHNDSKHEIEPEGREEYPIPVSDGCARCSGFSMQGKNARRCRTQTDLLSASTPTFCIQYEMHNTLFSNTPFNIDACTGYNEQASGQANIRATWLSLFFLNGIGEGFQIIEALLYMVVEQIVAQGTRIMYQCIAQVNQNLQAIR